MKIPVSVQACVMATESMFGVSSHIQTVQYKKYWEVWPSATSYWWVVWGTDREVLDHAPRCGQLLLGWELLWVGWVDWVGWVLEPRSGLKRMHGEAETRWERKRSNASSRFLTHALQPLAGMRSNGLSCTASQTQCFFSLTSVHHTTCQECQLQPSFSGLEKMSLLRL